MALACTSDRKVILWWSCVLFPFEICKRLFTSFNTQFTNSLPLSERSDLGGCADKQHVQQMHTQRCQPSYLEGPPLLAIWSGNP